MARRKRTYARRNKRPWSRVLPESLQEFLARRIIDLTSLVFLGIALWLLASLVSYHHGDPSFNSSGMAGSSAPVHNWGGRAGAYSADILLQTLGAGAFAFAIIVAVWSGRIFTRTPLTPFWLRLSCMIGAAVLWSVALARVPAGERMVQSYLGGSSGAILLNGMTSFMHGFGGGWEYVLVPLGCGAAALALTLVACAVTLDETSGFISRIKDLTLYALAYARYGVALFMDWVQRYNEHAERAGDEDGEMEKPQRAARPRREPVLNSGEDEDDEEDDDEPVLSYARKPAPPIHAPTRPQAPAKPRSKDTDQGRFALMESGEWELPSLSLLQEVPAGSQDETPDEKVLHKNAEMLQNVLKDFNISGDVVGIHPGPVVTLYELEPAPGTKTSRVISLSDDIARSMAAVSVRSAVVPGRNVIGIEMPNKKRQTVYMRDLLESPEAEKANARLPLVLGKDIGGAPVIADLARMPHLLVAGTTGSGKSVAINTMILSLLYRLPPEKCRFIMIDPKMLELSVYDDIPHLLTPVVTEPGKAVVALKWTIQEMEDRYRAMSKLGVRNIDGYNARLREARAKGEVLMRKVQTGFDADTGKPVYEEQPLDLTELPYIVLIVDEFADLMLVAGKDVESAVQRLAQMARAAGIHLIMATQRPSVDVITGVIKANLPTRISFQVTSKVDSRTILGEGGAEQLLGMGDMLYMASGGRIRRVHGPFVSDRDVENVVNFLKAQGEPAYIEDISSGGFEGGEMMAALFGGGEGGEGSSVDEMYDQAVALVARERKASTSFIQRYLQIGYNRAARIIEEMEKQGVVSPANRVGKREVLIGDYSEVG